MKEIELLKQAVKAAAKEIGKLAPDAGIVEKEGRGNFFTAADLASEKAIVDTIKQQFPKDTILSEETESALSNHALLSLDRLWVIDPIDGTNNFKNQRGYSSISLGYVDKGIIQAGAVYNFDRNELFIAKKGHGAFVNGKKISVGNQSNIGQGVVATDPYYTSEETRENLRRLLLINPTPFILMKGCGSLMMCEVASGRTDLYFHTSLKPWDNAAAFLIVQEAGGVVKGLQGEDVTFLSSSVVVGNAQLVDQFIASQSDL